MLRALWLAPIHLSPYVALRSALFLKLRLEVHGFEAVGANKAFPVQFLERKAAFLCLAQIPLGVAIFFSCFSTFLLCGYALQYWCA